MQDVKCVSKVAVVAGGIMGSLRILRRGPMQRIMWMMGRRKVEEGAAPF